MWRTPCATNDSISTWRPRIPVSPVKPDPLAVSSIQVGHRSTTLVGAREKRPDVLPDEASPFRKNICLSENQKSCSKRAVPPRHEGRDGQSSPDVRRDAMDALVRETNAPNVDGQAVWSWHPDAGA